MRINSSNLDENDHLILVQIDSVQTLLLFTQIPVRVLVLCQLRIEEGAVHDNKAGVNGGGIFSQNVTQVCGSTPAISQEYQI